VWSGRAGGSAAMLSMMTRTPAGHEIARGIGPVGKQELEARSEQSAWYNAAALEHEFGFAAKQEGSNFEHPLRNGQGDSGAPSAAQGSHEIAVGQWCGRCEIDDARKIFAFD